MRYLLFILFIGIAFAGCKQDPYDSGDTSLSYLKAEMVNMSIERGAVSVVVNDAFQTIPFPSDFRLSKDFENVDTTLRLMMYYNQVPSQPVQIVKTVPVSILFPVENQTHIAYKTDPVDLISAWKSEQMNYINLSLGVKTGVADDKQAVQTLMFMQDSLKIAPEGGRIRYITLFHSQSTVPQFVTKQVYLTLPVNDFKQGDEVVLTVNTYKGKVQKTFKK